MITVSTPFPKSSFAPSTSSVFVSIFLPDKGGMKMGIPIIIDCDPGVDDALAIILALKHPHISRIFGASHNNDSLDFLREFLVLADCFCNIGTWADCKKLDINGHWVNGECNALYAAEVDVNKFYLISAPRAILFVTSSPIMTSS